MASPAAALGALWSGIVALAVRLLFRVARSGTVPVRAREPLLYMARHPRRIDSLLLPLLLPDRPIVVLPSEEVRGRAFRWLLGAVPHLVMDVNHPLTVRRVLRVLAEGRSVLLYPEGRVLDSSGVMKCYPGPALVALHSGATVVPVHAIYASARSRRLRLHLGALTRIRVHGEDGTRRRRLRATRALQHLMEANGVDARERITLFDAFLQAVEREGRHTEIVEDLKEVPRRYGDLLRGSLALGRWANGFTQPADNVGVLLPNVVPTVCLVLGLSANARVPAMLNYSAGSRAVRAACTAANVRVVITSRAFVEQARLSPVVAALRHLRIVYLEDAASQLRLWDKLWLVLLAMRMPRRVSARVDAHAPAVVLFTSGSETHPKGVALSHDAILANIHQIGAVIDFTSRDRVLNALPLYHSYGFTAGMMLCLVTGVKLFLYLSPLKYRAIPEIAYRRNVTYLFGTGTFLGYYAKHANPLDFGSVRYVISGGEKLGEEVVRLYLEKFGLRIFEGYGATECAPVIALSTPQCHQAGTVGRPLPGVRTRLEKLEGVEHGGVLHLTGPNLMLGYYRYDMPGVIDPPRSRFGEGWYSTGDVVDILEDGVLRVVGRVRRFAKIAGEMVSLDAIESLAYRASPQHRHAIVLRTESVGGETTVLFTTDPHLTRHGLTRAARESGAQDLAVARKVVCMPDLPVLGSGKTDYVTLQTLDLTEGAANEPVLPDAVSKPPAAKA
ncbi:MAG: AMP-binding protein [Burkholderiales bacterium]|nr:AMP-binding protein [Burkholderiales bacterium]